MARTAPLTSSLSSVVDNKQVKKFGWRRVDKNNPLAGLHAKFWGQGVVEVKAKEPPAKAKATSDPSGSSQKLDRAMDNTAESNSEDDDITADCFGLEITDDIRAFDSEIHKIWVRAEYIRIYKFIVEYYTAETKYTIRAPAVVLTGQPGIGKSIFLYYALYRCLAEKKPVIWLYRRSPYMFVDEGVYAMGSQFLKVQYKHKVWTLIDSDEYKNGVPEDFVPHHTPFFVIYVTPFESDRWSRMNKTTSDVVVIMNPWTRGEIHRAAELCPMELDPKTIDDAYDQLGPTPHLCLHTAFNPLQLTAYMNGLHTVTGLMTLQRLKELLHKVWDWNMDDVSRKVCLIKRPKKDIVGPEFYVQPITDNIQSKLAICMRDLDSCQQITSYRYFARDPCLKWMAGPLFEGFCHRRFQEKIFIHYIPMVCLVRDEWRHQPEWYSSHNPIQNQELEAPRQDALRCRATLSVRPSHACEYTDKDLPGLDPEEDVYYVPTMENIVALDSFILHGGRLYMFQFMYSGAHDIKAGLISRFAGCDKFPPPDEWRFIFVIPDDIKVFKCTYQLTPEIQELKLFSAQIAMDDAQEKLVAPPESFKRKPSVSIGPPPKNRR